MAIRIEPGTSRDRAYTKRHVVTLDEYDKMVAFAVFSPEFNVELFRGEIIDMPPVGSEHEATVSDLNLFLGEQLRRKAILWPQGNSIGIPQSNSRPHPDTTVLRWRDDRYHGKRPEPADILLVVEVSDSALKFDRKEKLQLYAEAGIPEYWIVNLVDRVIEVYSEADKAQGEYRASRVVRNGDVLLIPGGPGGEIQVSDILGDNSKSSL